MLNCIFSFLFLLFLFPPISSEIVSDKYGSCPTRSTDDTLNLLSCSNSCCGSDPFNNNSLEVICCFLMFERTIDAVSCARLSGLESADIDDNIHSLKKCADECCLVHSKISQRAFAVVISGIRRSVAVSEEVNMHSRVARILETTCANRKSRSMALLWFRQIVLLNFCVKRFETDAKNLRCCVFVPADSFKHACYMKFFDFVYRNCASDLRAACRGSSFFD